MRRRKRVEVVLIERIVGRRCGIVVAVIAPAVGADQAVVRPAAEHGRVAPVDERLLRSQQQIVAVGALRKSRNLHGEPKAGRRPLDLQRAVFAREILDHAVVSRGIGHRRDENAVHAVHPQEVHAARQRTRSERLLFPRGRCGVVPANGAGRALHLKLHGCVRGCVQYGGRVSHLDRAALTVRVAAGRSMDFGQVLFGLAARHVAQFGGEGCVGMGLRRLRCIGFPLLVGDHRRKTLQNSRQLCAGDRALRRQRGRGRAGDQFLGVGPLHSGLRIRMNRRSIRVAGESALCRHIQLFVFGKAVQHNGELLARK